MKLALRQDLPRWGRLLLGASLLILLIVLWTAVTAGEVETRVVAPTILPSPWEVLGSWGSLVHDRDLFGSIMATLRRVFFGFGLAVLVGVPLGMFAGAWRPLSAFLGPLVLFARNIPIAALVPLTMVWFGLGEVQKIMFIFMATFAFIFSDASAEVNSVPEKYVETSQTLGVKPWQIFLHVLVPLALPAVVTKLRALFGLAFGYIMLAELVNTNSGLGFLLRMSQRRGQTEHMFLVLFVITILAYVLDRGFLWLQRGMFPYKRNIR